MRIFYRTPDCPGCNKIQEILETLVIAHKVVVVRSRDEIPKALSQGIRLPVLVDEGKIIQGSKAILAYTEELKNVKEIWDKFQSDACYCDEDGNVE